MKSKIHNIISFDKKNNKKELGEGKMLKVLWRSTIIVGNNAVCYVFNFLFSLYETIKQDIGKNAFLVQKNYILSKFYYLKMCFTIFSKGGGILSALLTLVILVANALLPYPLMCH